jgi:hypothetical protein
LADRSSQLIITALTRAATSIDGLPLHGSSKRPGLFAASAAAREAAEQCKAQGLLRILREDTSGKTAHDICAITDKGIAHLLAQVSPKSVLEQMVQALHDQKAQVAQLAAAAQKWQEGIGVLHATIEKVLDQTRNQSPATAGPAFSINGSDLWMAAIIAILAEWRSSSRSSDCPLPELYRHAAKSAPSLSVGRFHDGIRSLYAQQRIYLHPWTGPLYELPEPLYALLIGHEIVYYASTR